jgi:hypothetical protein
MEKDRTEADKQPKQQSVLSDKQEFGGEAEKKMKQMGERSPEATAKATGPGKK